MKNLSATSTFLPSAQQELWSLHVSIPFSTATFYLLHAQYLTLINFSISIKLQFCATVLFSSSFLELKIRCTIVYLYCRFQMYREDESATNKFSDNLVAY